MNICYSNKWFKILKKGKQYIIKEKNDGIVVIIKEKNYFYLLFAYRVVINKMSLEIARGYKDENESDIEAVIREVKEEMNIKIKENEITYLGSVSPNNGILNSCINVYLAETKVDIKDIKPQKEENIKKIIKLNEKWLKYCIRKNIIFDSFTLSSFMLYFSKKGK